MANPVQEGRSRIDPSDSAQRRRLLGDHDGADQAIVDAPDAGEPKMGRVSTAWSGESGQPFASDHRKMR